jgi:hypothetical protein
MSLQIVRYFSMILFSIDKAAKDMPTDKYLEAAELVSRDRAGGVTRINPPRVERLHAR